MTPQRFWEKISQSGDCWEWTGARDDKGYARFTALILARLAALFPEDSA